MIKKNFPSLFIAFLIGVTSFSQTVSSVTELQSGLRSASAGTTITIANGTYTNADLEIEATGTAANPIIIQAETPGGVIFEDNCRIKMGGEFITLTGVVFTGNYSLSDSGADSYVISFNNGSDCDNCTVTQVQIDDYNPSSTDDDLRWVRVYGQDNEISYNTFINKTSIGSMLFNQRENGIEDRMKIHHNYFAYRNQIGIADSANDIDVMRIGDSSKSLTNSSSEIYDNYFYEANGGEPEVISNKSSNNQYYNNTFENYLGSLSLRHGNDCKVYNNFFLNPGQNESYFNGGIRVEGERHMVYNNYIQGTNGTKQNSNSKAGSLGGINVSAGQSEDNFVPNGYGQVINAIIVNNTFVNCDQGLRIGPDSGGANQDLAPDSITIANNLFVNCGEYIEEERPATNSIYTGNMFEGNGSEITGFSSESGLLSSTIDADGYYPIIASSPAVNASVGDYSVYFMDDAFASSRIGAFDVGAQEYGATIVKGPYTQSDVGVTVGFGAIEDNTPTLIAFSTDTTFDKETNSTVINITANVDWAIVTDVSWITLSAISGTGNDAVNLGITENTTNQERTGVITINEVGGDNNLSVTITITQSNISAPINLEIAEVTAVGTQTDDDSGEIINGPENSVDNIDETRWSALSNDGSAYITYDLGCVKELTEIQILFFSSTERTTQFILATSEDGNSYTDLSTAPISSTIQSDAESFDLSGLQAQYVRIYGYGNSEDDSDWNSITEVDIYGYDACEDVSLSIIDNNLQTQGVSLYPVPVTNGELSIASSKFAVNGIEVYNMTGQKVISAKVNNQNTTALDVTNLPSGVYFIVLEEIGVGKFIVN